MAVNSQVCEDRLAVKNTLSLENSSPSVNRIFCPWLPFADCTLNMAEPQVLEEFHCIVYKIDCYVCLPLVGDYISFWFVQ